MLSFATNQKQVAHWVQSVILSMKLAVFMDTGLDDDPANCASECIRPIVSVIQYEAGPAAIFDFLCTTFEIIMNWLSLRKVDRYE